MRSVVTRPWIDAMPARSEGAVCVVLPWAALASSNERNQRRGGRGHSRAYKASRDAVYLVGMAQLRERSVPLPAFPDGPVVVRMAFYPPDRRRRDESNFLKVLLDGLNGIAWKDDAQVTQWHGSREAVDAKRPRVEIAIEGAA